MIELFIISISCFFLGRWSKEGEIKELREWSNSQKGLIKQLLDQTKEEILWEK